MRDDGYDGVGIDIAFADDHLVLGGKRNQIGNHHGDVYASPSCRGSFGLRSNVVQFVPFRRIC